MNKNTMRNNPFLTKWKSSSTCLILAWQTWLTGRDMVFKLSHQITSDVGKEICNSERREPIQSNLEVVSTNAWYSI